MYVYPSLECSVLCGVEIYPKYGYGVRVQWEPWPAALEGNFAGCECEAAARPPVFFVNTTSNHQH